MIQQKHQKNAQENQNKGRRLIGNPYEQFNIWPKDDDYIIPKIIKAPFDHNIENQDYNLDLIIQPYFSENPPSSFPIEHFQLFQTLYMTDHKEQLIELIKTQIINYATIFADHFENSFSPEEIIARCHQFVPNIQKTISYFKFLAHNINFESIFYQTIHEKLINSSQLIQIISSTIAEILIQVLLSNEKISSSKLDIMIFAEKSELSNIELINTQINQFYQMKLKESSYSANALACFHCNIFESFNALFHSMPKEAQHLTEFLCYQFRVQIINTNISNFILHVGKIILKKPEMIDTFYACIDPSTPIEQYTQFIKTIIDESIDMRKISKLYSFIGQQSTQMRTSLERFFKNRFFGREKEISRAFAELLDSDFRAGVYNPDFIAELRMIPDKFQFQSTHSNLMLRRALDTDFHFDRRFVHDAKRLFDDNNIETLKEIVDDVDQGKLIVKDFLNENKDIPPYLHFHLFSWKNWIIRSPYAYKFPESLQPYITSFAEYVHSKSPKKIQIHWILEVSTCTLRIGKFEINCNGVTGSVLLSLNQAPKTATAVKRELNEASNLDVDCILSQFINEKGYRIIRKAFQGNQLVYSINADNADLQPPLNTSNAYIPINTHLITPQSRTENQEMNKDLMNIYSKNIQIDGIIISLLKSEKHVTQEDIIRHTANQIHFPIDEQMIQERIDKLERRNFIAHDPMNINIYNYVP